MPQTYCLKADIEALWTVAAVLASVDDDASGALSATEEGYITRAIQRAAERMNAFFIVPTSVKGAIQSVFSTHPPMEKRIERLQRLESQLQGTA